MSIVNVDKIKSPWDITIFLNNGYLDDIEIHFSRVILRECEIPDYIVNWCNNHLHASDEVRISYNAINSNAHYHGHIGRDD